MTNPNVINTDSHTTIRGWTWENFLRYVEYQSMFHGECERTHPADDADAMFMLDRTSHGYNGFTINITEYIGLYDADGAVPEFTDNAPGVKAVTPWIDRYK